VPEQTLGNTVQMAGLTVQNVLSAAVGIAVAVALIRGFVRTGTDRIGNFWVDLTRRRSGSCCRSPSSRPSCC
jgi:K+-transporting ATPase ATPase A chain